MLSSRLHQGCCFVIIVFIAAANSKKHLMKRTNVAKRLGVSTKDPNFRKFFGFIRSYNKTYEDSQLKYRFKVFKNNLKKIKKLNKAEHGTAVFGITPFSDLTADEFLSRHGTTIKMRRPPRSIDQSKMKGKSRFKKLTMKKPPKTCDWRNAKPPIVTPIRDQGSCGSCWIFSTIAVLESQYQLRKRLKKQEKFSEQQILDCSDEEFTCDTGGYSEIAISIIKNKLKSKIAARSAYPYLNEGLPYKEDGKGKCVRGRQPNYKFNNLEDTDFTDYPGLKKGEDKENFMARYVAEQGPIVAFILFEWAQHYTGGIMQTSRCNYKSDEKEEAQRGHFVAIVGFGQDKKKKLPYWILKNSWDIDEENPQNKGYLYMARGKDMCSVTVQVTAINMSPNIHPEYKKAGCPKYTSLPPNPYNKKRKAGRERTNDKKG